jgi:hypothetical protein
MEMKALLEWIYRSPLELSELRSIYQRLHQHRPDLHQMIVNNQSLMVKYGHAYIGRKVSSRVDGKGELVYVHHVYII